MSKITNLIGTTWRLDASNLGTVTREYGVFDITAYGKGIIEGYLCDCSSSKIYVGFVGVAELPAVPQSSVITVLYDEAVTVVDGEQVALNNILNPYGGEGVYEGYYEFTITGGEDISNPLFIDFINTYGTLVSGGEPPTAEGVKSKLQSLITASNAKTGKSDANLTDAVKTLLEGFGSGEGIFAEQENEHGTTVVLGADLQEKTIDITANGTVEVTPDEGYALKKVTANVDVPKDGVDKIQRYIELNRGSAAYLFKSFLGESLDEVIDGTDFSVCTSTIFMFEDCTNLKSVPLFDTSRDTAMSNMFSSCKQLQSIPSLDARVCTVFGSTFSGCNALTECWIRNIKANLQVSNGTSYGHLLTVESLLHLCKECRETTYSRTLTMGTTNLAKLEGIYVKLIDITDDMRAEDDLIDEKYPFVQCESTDDGAMTIQDYMATKKWSLA